MQIPATGFRAIMISCLNEPPRKNPISGLPELAAKLSVDTDLTLLCLEDQLKVWVILDIFDNGLHIIVGDSVIGVSENMKSVNAFNNFLKTLSSKIRYYGCKEYVQNGSGVFFGFENRIKATVEGDAEIFWSQFTRLDYLPNIAFMTFKNTLQRPLSRSLLRVFESQIESHVDALRYIRQKKRMAQNNQRFISPYRIEDIRPFIQLWFCGIFLAGIGFLFECVISRSQGIFFRHYYNSMTLSCRP